MRTILVLYRHPPGTAMRPAIKAHLQALERALRTVGADDRVVYHNSFDEDPSLALRLLEPDAVVLHTTFLCMRWSDHFGSFSWRYRWIRDIDCTKIAIPQDEYDHSEILDEWLDNLRVTDIFTNFDAARRALIYPTLRASDVSFHEVLTGYIDEEMAASAAKRLRPPAERRADIVYRASHLPYWFGAHGQLKHQIADVVVERAADLGLVSDISTSYDDVIYGEAWTDFLLSGRTVIGAESGSSALDRRGEVQAAFTAMLAAEPELSFEEASARLKPGWDGHELGAISPRHFEAVVTKTCQILVRGRYSGVLEPGSHYLPLNRDFSNLDEVLEQVRDTDLLAQIADTAYEDIYRSGRFTYDVFGEQVAAALDRERPAAGLRRALAPVLLGVAPVEEATRRIAARTAAAGVSRIRAPRLNGLRLHAPSRMLRAPAEPRPAPIGIRQVRSVRTGHYARIARLVARPAAEPAVCSLLLKYTARGGWRYVAPRSLARDLLRLGLARRTKSFEELRRDNPPGLVWDHCEVGTEAPIKARRPGLGVVALGDSPYEFPALTELIRRYAHARRGGHDGFTRD
jgi:hypothetical protein